MDADQGIRNGNDFCLVNYPTATNYLTDQTSATSVIAARQATKNILYTVVNSRAYAEENLNPGLPTWQILLIAGTVLAVALLGLWEFMLVKNYRKARKDTIVETVPAENK